MGCTLTLPKKHFHPLDDPLHAHAAALPYTCRQVISPEEITIRDKPCWGGQALGTLNYGDTVTYTNTYSKQTDACTIGSARALCWVQVRLPSWFVGNTCLWQG